MAIDVRVGWLGFTVILLLQVDTTAVLNVQQTIILLLASNVCVQVSPGVRFQQNERRTFA